MDALEGGGTRPMRLDVLLAGEFASAPEVEMARAMRSLNGPCARLTVAVVAVPYRLLGFGMPFCGAGLIEQMHDCLDREVQRRACRVACMAPEDVCVQHLVVEGWRDLARHVELRDYDVVVCERPRRWQDRRLVRRAPWSIAADGQAGHSTLGFHMA
jgi:hypothetical protein